MFKALTPRVPYAWSPLEKYDVKLSTNFSNLAISGFKGHERIIFRLVAVWDRRHMLRPPLHRKYAEKRRL